MARVLCTLAFASDLINGVAFERTDDGMLSEEISDEVAAQFTAIPGYELVGEKKPEKPASDTSTSGSDGNGETAAHQTAKPARRRAN